MNLKKYIIAITLILSASFSQYVCAQFYDSWTDTYSPTWTPLSLDQMTSKQNSSSSSYKINTYQPVIAPAAQEVAPPADLLIPEGAKGVRISKYGTIRYLDDDEVVSLYAKANFDTKEITGLLKARDTNATIVIGTITHYNANSDSFGYVHSGRLAIDPWTYSDVSDAVQPPETFTIPEGAIGVRIKEWSTVKYLKNNMNVNGSQGNFITMKITGTLSSADTVIGDITVNNYKKYDNMDSFGYIYPDRLYYAFTRGKDENGLSPVPADLVVPNGAKGVRVGDWGGVYYLSDNKLVSATVLGKFGYLDKKTGSLPDKFIIADVDAAGNEKEIGEITKYLQDVDIYSYGHIYTNLLQNGAEPGITTPPPAKAKTFFGDVPADAPFSEAVLYAGENNWIAKTVKFKPNSNMTRCGLAELVMRASEEPVSNTFKAIFSDVKKTNSKAKYIYAGVEKGYWKAYAKGSSKFGCNKSIRSSTLAAILKKMGKTVPAELKSNSQKYLKKADAIISVYKVFGPAQ